MNDARGKINQLLSYVYEDRRTVPYMYINLRTYKLDDPNIKIIYNSTNTGGGYLKYYDCLHFYTKRPFDYTIDEILEVIEVENPRVIMLQAEIGRRLESSLVSNYILERNHIIDMDEVSKGVNHSFLSVQADKEDIPEIVDLLLTEEEYAIVYERDVLLKQLYDRYDSGISRFYVIKDTGKIIACCSSYGETDDMAIVGGVIVHRNYRRRGFASDVDTHIICDIQQKGKSCISFVNYENIPSLNFHKKLGGFPYSTYYKYIRRQML